MQESFFYTATIEAKQRFAPEILHLNFAHLSPYKEFEILPFYEGNRVLLWFMPQSPTTPIIIPEAYLLSLYCKEQSENALFIIEDTLDKLLVIKNGRLEAAYCGYRLQEQKESLLDEYGVEDIYLLSAAKAKELQESYLNSYRQHYHWYYSKVSFKEKAIEYLDKATIPISIIIALFIAIEFGRDYYIQKHYEALEQEYLMLKKQNDPYREELKALKESISFNNSFYDDVLLYPNSLKVLNSMTEIISHDLNNTIKGLKLTGAKLELSLETNDPITILEETLKSRYFIEFKIKSSRKVRKTNKEYVVYEGILKKLKDVNGE